MGSEQNELGYNMSIYKTSFGPGWNLPKHIWVETYLSGLEKFCQKLFNTSGILEFGRSSATTHCNSATRLTEVLYLIKVKLKCIDYDIFFLFIIIELGKLTM